MTRPALTPAILAALILAACSKSSPVSEVPSAAAAGGLPPSHGMVMQTTTVISNAGSDTLIGYRILVAPTRTLRLRKA